MVGVGQVGADIVTMAFLLMRQILQGPVMAGILFPTGLRNAPVRFSTTSILSYKSQAFLRGFD